MARGECLKGTKRESCFTFFPLKGQKEGQNRDGRNAGRLGLAGGRQEHGHVPRVRDAAGIADRGLSRGARVLPQMLSRSCPRGKGAHHAGMTRTNLNCRGAVRSRSSSSICGCAASPGRRMGVRVRVCVCVCVRERGQGPILREFAVRDSRRACGV